MDIKLETYGDLKKIIKSITSKQKSSAIRGGIKGKATDIVIDAAVEALKAAIPGIGLAKHGYDIFKGAIKKPDTEKTDTWLDKLDIDDNMSKIIDDTVENGFIQMITKTIESESDDKPLEQDFNMNQKLVDYLKQNYSGRTITGVRENKMKKSQLKQVIKEEILKTLKEIAQQPTVKQTSASTAYKQSSSTASSINAKASQIKSITDLPGAFETWFNSLGIKNAKGISQTSILSSIRDTLNKMGIK